MVFKLVSLSRGTCPQIMKHGFRRTFFSTQQDENANCHPLNVGWSDCMKTSQGNMTKERQWPMKCWYGSSSSDIRHFNPRIFAEPDRIYWWEGWKMTRDELCFALGDQQIKLPSNLSCYTGDSGKLVKT